jgi:hypothetical protein
METRKPATACSQMKRRSVEGLFQHPRLFATGTRRLRFSSLVRETNIRLNADSSVCQSRYTAAIAQSAEAGSGTGDENHLLGLHNLSLLNAGNKVFLHAGYGALADSEVRKRRASVRICLILAAELFGRLVVLYTSRLEPIRTEELLLIDPAWSANLKLSRNGLVGERFMISSKPTPRELVIATAINGPVIFRENRTDGMFCRLPSSCDSGARSVVLPLWG